MDDRPLFSAREILALILVCIVAIGIWMYRNSNDTDIQTNFDTNKPQAVVNSSSSPSPKPSFTGPNDEEMQARIDLLDQRIVDFTFAWVSFSECETIKDRLNNIREFVLPQSLPAFKARLSKGIVYDEKCQVVSIQDLSSADQYRVKAGLSIKVAEVDVKSTQLLDEDFAESVTYVKIRMVDRFGEPVKSGASNMSEPIVFSWVWQSQNWWVASD